MQDPNSKELEIDTEMNTRKLEEVFAKYIQNLNVWVQDGITEVNLEFLKNTQLLHTTEEQEKELQKQYPFYFQVIETPDKVTLFNAQFVVWIVPKLIEEVPTTITLISLLQRDIPQLEIVFSTQGIYNTPKYVLKVLRHYLTEIVETEEEITKISSSG